MPPRKRLRTCASRGAAATVPASPPAAPSQPLALPVDLLLQIAARSDVAAVIRCAATCKLLRREILNPAFIHSVSRAPPDGVGVVPPRLVGFLGGSSAFSLAHPETPAARSFAKNFAPFVRRSAGGLLKEYEVRTTRGGLAVLERRVINGRRRSERRADVCVYNPVTGDRAFFPFPPDIRRNEQFYCTAYTYVVVTAADGAIGCPFMLLAAINFIDYDNAEMEVAVQTVSPSSDAGGGQWSPVKYVRRLWFEWKGLRLADTNPAVVLRGVVHWLMNSNRPEDRGVFTYDVVTGATETAWLPSGLRPPYNRDSVEAKLGASPDGKLTLLVANEMSVSLWVRTAVAGHYNSPDWERHALVDTEAPIRSALDPKGSHGIEISEVKLMNFGDQRSGAVFLRVNVANGHPGGCVVVTCPWCSTWRRGRFARLGGGADYCARWTSRRLGYPP
jgi:hypothetical protein